MTVVSRRYSTTIWTAMSLLLLPGAAMLLFVTHGGRSLLHNLIEWGEPNCTRSPMPMVAP